MESFFLKKAKLIDFIELHEDYFILEGIKYQHNKRNQNIKNNI